MRTAHPTFVCRVLKGCLKMWEEWLIVGWAAWYAAQRVYKPMIYQPFFHFQAA
ncbi:hypothetical protein [Alysiella crassa]|uniref:hypothetical protein n=1 Tax=Alysiella crassa TaxID=153491 RepID=UPI0012EBD2CB|nr:hypothetical protein [Alysiella crassa]UOP05919.1 hypothetical protein LVJ80_08510 [Alysiella crassa]